MLCCCGVSSGPTSFWSIAIPVCFSNEFVLLKKHTTKRVRALRECVYKGKRERYRALELHISCGLVLLHVIFLYTLIQPRREEMESSSKLPYIYFS